MKEEQRSRVERKGPLQNLFFLLQETEREADHAGRRVRVQELDGSANVGHLLEVQQLLVPRKRLFPPATVISALLHALDKEEHGQFQKINKK